MKIKWDDKISATLWSFPTRLDEWSDIYITVVVDKATNNGANIGEIFYRLFSYVKENNIQILQEKIFGLSSHMEKILTIRNKQFKNFFGNENGLPVTFVQGTPCVESKLSGIQIIGIIPNSDDISIKTFTVEEQPIGRVFENKFFRKIFLSGISTHNSRCSHSFHEQAKGMFVHCKDLLAGQGVDVSQIIRTWIYLPKILDWYEEFNNVRTACFKEFGLITPKKTYLPASTGIQGERFPGEECFMDVLALAPKDKDKTLISVMSNTRQNEPYEYKSSFSRGISVTSHDLSTIFISGTASINKDGKTVYRDDEQGQILETLLDVAALLDTKNLTLKDIVMATAYCKNQQTYEIFKKVSYYLNLNEIPFLPVFADACRKELLFEVDAIARTKVN